MGDEIVDALKRAPAVDEATGLTIEKLMQQPGRNLDPVVMYTKLLLSDRKVQVSDPNALSRNHQHVWPATRIGQMFATGEELSQARREWKEENFHPIVVWLGPALREQVEEQRNKDEDGKLLRDLITRPIVTVQGDNSGRISIGDGNKQESSSPLASQ